MIYGEILSEKRLLRLTGHGLKVGDFDKAVLAVGSTESHGEHLPHGTDTLVAYHVAEAVAERVERLLVLPALPYGMSAHYSSFPIAVTLSTETLMRVLREVFASLLGHGITKLLLVNGHDGNISAIEAATREFRVEHPEMRIAVLEAWWVTAGELVPKGTFEVWDGLGHGGEGETSIHVKWRFDEITPYAVTGDPTKASVEKGRLMRDALVDLLVDFIEEMEGKDWDVTVKP
jgi:creatinine amidohydrolase